MIMIELEALNWSFQLLIYIYDMISGMSKADVKNVRLIMHTDSVIPGVFHQSNPPTLGMLLNEVITNEENGETNELY